ncbi:hypothetical protein BANT918_03387 [Brevibacterium antiquum CNRZ 918]|uniref:Uncharacterized protein n=1 Tax=Brevibacterium antiquum CNRZ 918 TaxID=1255637 RepID=A0A2H1L0E4_9MICO|nr:hypothetical protein BANT918_03387 [Brevibacterium antiquum CNRZ 918]
MRIAGRFDDPGSTRGVGLALAVTVMGMVLAAVAVGVLLADLHRVLHPRRSCAGGCVAPVHGHVRHRRGSCAHQFQDRRSELAQASSVARRRALPSDATGSAVAPEAAARLRRCLRSGGPVAVKGRRAVECRESGMVTSALGVHVVSPSHGRAMIRFAAYCDRLISMAAMSGPIASVVATSKMLRSRASLFLREYADGHRHAASRDTEDSPEVVDSLEPVSRDT